MDADHKFLFLEIQEDDDPGKSCVCGEIAETAQSMVFIMAYPFSAVNTLGIRTFRRDICGSRQSLKLLRSFEE